MIDFLRDEAVKKLIDTRDNPGFEKDRSTDSPADTSRPGLMGWYNRYSTYIHGRNQDDEQRRQPNNLLGSGKENIESRRCPFKKKRRAFNYHLACEKIPWLGLSTK